MLGTLQGSAACKPLGCSSMQWGRTCLLSARMCDAATLTVVEVWDTFPYPPSQVISWKHSPRRALPLDMALQEEQAGGLVQLGGCQLAASRKQTLG